MELSLLVSSSSLCCLYDGRLSDCCVIDIVSFVYVFTLISHLVLLDPLYVIYLFEMSSLCTKLTL
jgi:hypothetical protein